MRFRRRRARGRWFPTNSNPPGNEVALQSNLTGGGFWGPGNFAADAFPIIGGNLDEPALATGTVVGGIGGLGAVLAPGNTYSVRRIVGQIGANFYDPGVTNGLDTHAYVFFGIFQDAVDNNGVLQNLAAWNPTNIEAGMKRWVFHRWWHLGVVPISNAAFTAGGDVLNNQRLPPSVETSGGGNQNCGFIDIKTKLTVNFEHRLFAMFGCIGATNGLASTVNVFMLGWSDLRMFAIPIRGRSQ